MTLITHGSDLTLAPTLRLIAESVGGGPRRAIQSVADAGFVAVQLDATMPGLRPRELDASARRDLGATVRRAGLSVAGVDFFIPQDHFRSAEHLDRAAEAAGAAIAFAADLGRVPVSMALPIDDVDEALIDTLLGAADGYGVRLAVHHEAGPQQLNEWLKPLDTSIIGGGIDPANLLAARHDPAGIAQSLGGKLAVARLSDARRGQGDGARSVAGQGDLDLTAYRVSVDLSPKRAGPVVLDLRALADPLNAAAQAAGAWDAAAMRM